MRLLRQRDISGIFQILPACAQSKEDKRHLKELLFINPLTAEPYMPGSTIRTNLIRTAETSGKWKKEKAMLFNESKRAETDKAAPLRLIVRDALPTAATASILKSLLEKFDLKVPPFLQKDELFNIYFQYSTQPLCFELNIGVRIYEDSVLCEDDMIKCALDILRAWIKSLPHDGEFSLHDLCLDGESVNFL